MAKFDIIPQLEVWTLINQKSTVIPPSLMVLFSTGDLDDHFRVDSSHQDTWGDYFCQDSSYISRSFKWSFVLRLFG